jgi:hypothetical protein
MRGTGLNLSAMAVGRERSHFLDKKLAAARRRNAAHNGLASSISVILGCLRSLDYKEAVFRRAKHQLQFCTSSTVQDNIAP